MARTKTRPTPPAIKEFDKTLAPFLQHHVGESYFKRGNFVDNETFEEIAYAFVEWFNKNIKQIVTNVQAVYALTGNEYGYKVLVDDWKRRREWKGVGDVPQFTNAEIEADLTKNVGLVLNHLYQQNDYGKETFRSGIGGLLTATSITVEVRQSEKRNKLDVIFDYGIEISLGCSNHTEIEAYES